MTEKIPEKEIYSQNNTVGLVTNASYLNQNLALLNTDDYYKSDSLAVAHEGFINYIPLINTTKRCKYVPICVGCDRGKGKINWMRWIKMGDDTFFVCLSTVGVQFFDVDLTDVHFEYDFKDLNSRLSLPLGACLLGDTLFVGAAMGVIGMFRSSNETLRMINHLKIAPFMYLDGANGCLLTAAREQLKSYRVQRGSLKLVAELRETLFLYSVIKVVQDILFIGHHTGEISIIAFPDLKLAIKEKIHKEEITAVDYSIEKHVLLTASHDMSIKVLEWNGDEKKLWCIFRTENNPNPICGIGFTNRNCTEFCTVMANSLVVTFYTETCKEEVEKNEEEEFVNADLI